MTKENLLKGRRFLPYNTNIKDKARFLRNNSTEAERKIWKEYLSKLSFTVNRQKTIDRFIVDFYIAKLKLVIEVDGKIHDNLKEYDKEREDILKSYDLKVLRITNRSILNNPQKTYKKIDEIIFKLKMI